ncbi:gamma-glutamyltransferase [Fimbriiglobus ruber]|uniref:Glutathione hydrolase proenzyme n=1 Tax=Fimbriiglobus ruber TaxID=1908690 RepID=A0A225DQ71_9BACT|nr:gamma-glutamyltransferase [Fimbriiglobus ruber]OWK43421.1 Gamma-glutamyltranspeptidase [Fimbriiglobus ruber]
MRLERFIPACILTTFLLLFVSPVPTSAADPAPPAKGGVVVSVSGPASDVGAAVLRKGGTAVDAAVATAFALAVTYPAAGNVGGGGYLLVHPNGSGDPAVFDFREVAPAAATRDMFVKLADRSAHRRIGVPGTVAGLAMAHKAYGKLPWAELVAPAVKLAGEGFELDAFNAASISATVRNSVGDASAEFRRVFGKPGGGSWKVGDRLVQPDLKETLARIAEKGPDGFYTGKTADLIAAEMTRGGGLITREDLAAYKPVRRVPVVGKYRGYDVYTAPPSSSGGFTLLEQLNILETFDFKPADRWEPRTIHLIVEAMRRAYRDRAHDLGDPAFTPISRRMLDKAYAKELAAGIDPKRATPSADLAGDIPLALESEQTTHFSVVDGSGAAVSLTYTLENSYGGKVVVRGAGFLMNDEMNDFGWLPGVTNPTGRIGTPPNLVAPGKRMLSSMCPTILVKNDTPVLVTGSPGGRTIINTVLNVVVNTVDFGMDLRAAVDAPRIHHQWFPDVIRGEAAFVKGHPELVAKLKEMGHRVDQVQSQGDAHSIWIDPATGRVTGVADRRISGKASAE